MGQALIVIDMQAGLWEETAGADDVLDRVRALVGRARGAGVPVVWVVDDNVVPPDLHPALETGGEPVIHKRHADAFSGTVLGATLAGLGADAVVICGFHTDFCIDTTVRRAAQEGLDVTLVGDAHATFDRPGLPAAAVVAHHNVVLANLAASGRISVRPAAEVVFG